MNHFAEFGPFCVHWRSAALAPLLDPLLSEARSAGPGGRPTIRVFARRVAERLPAPDEREAFFFGDVRAFLRDGDVLLADGVSQAVVRADGESIHMRVHRDSLDAQSPFGTHGAPGMLAVAARARGVFHMHAALVTFHDRPTLVIGQGHAGKTTTALSLIDAGGGWAGDDLALFAPDPQGGVAFWGVPRLFHLRPRTAALFPAIATGGETVTVRGDQRIDVALSRVFPGRRQAGALRPEVLVLPHIVDAPTTEAFDLTPAETLGPRLQASAMIVADELGRQQDQLDVLGRLASSARPVSLLLGRDGLEDGAAAARALARLLG